MALSGEIWGKWDGNHNAWSHERLDSRLTWSATQNVANNTSTITAVLHYYCAADLANQVSTYYNGTAWRITIDGTAVNMTDYTFNVAGKTYLKIMTASRTISHASDGTKTFSISAISTSKPGAWLGGPSGLSGSFTLNTIPRASTLSSFSMGANLKVGTANSINLGLSRASTSFKHHIYLKHGTTTIASWTNQNVPSSLPVTATQVNTLLARIPKATTAGMTLQVQTVSGTNGSNIGGVLSRTATATVDSTVRPTATVPSVAIYGTGHDKTIGKYVQSKSRITASFTSAAVGGASITSHYMTVRRLSDGADSQTISGTSGTTGKAVTLSGTYRISTYVRDGRGRTAITQSKDITVHAYAAPKISSFSAVRQSTATILSISRSGTWSHLGGDNTLTIRVQHKLSTASSWTTTDTTTSTTGSFTGSFTKTGFDVLKSYDFLLTLTDQFGTKSTSVGGASTQPVVLDIHKDEGIGVGKIHEQGALDVAGDVYFDGVKVDIQGWKLLGATGYTQGSGNYDIYSFTMYHNPTLRIALINFNVRIAGGMPGGHVIATIKAPYVPITGNLWGALGSQDGGQFWVRTNGEVVPYPNSSTAVQRGYMLYPY